MALPLESAGVTEAGNPVYAAAAKGGDQDMMFYVEWDQQGQKAVDYWLVPFTTSEDGHIVLDKDQYVTEPGDQLRFYYPFVDAVTEEETYELGPTLTMTGDPVLSLAKVPGTAFYFSIISDLKDNMQVSEIREVR
jgi:hypothetical protein